MKRPTIIDIAKAAGVSKATVSCALNNRPGVSEQNRARIRKIAESIGWTPNTAARALSNSRAGAVGLVVRRSPRVLAAEPYFIELFAGIEQELATMDMALLMHMVSSTEAELEVYKQWWSRRQVDGLILLDIEDNDPRIDLVSELGFPTVVIGQQSPLPVVSSVQDDQDGPAVEVLEHLAALGHRRIGRVSGPNRYKHTRQREAALEREARRIGIPKLRTIETDYSGDAGGDATLDLLYGKNPPTAIIYDNDIMAATSLSIMQVEGLSIPGDVSLIGWDDSHLSTLIRPELTALSRDIPRHGATAAQLLRELLDGKPSRTVTMPPAQLIRRRSTAAVCARWPHRRAELW